MLDQVLLGAAGGNCKDAFLKQLYLQYVGLWTLTAVKMLGLLATAKATAVYNII
ncbi:MAG: hypothetical protein ACRC7H_00015 [Plesiomonas shigelloides]